MGYLWIIDTDLSGSVPSQLGLLTSLQSLQLQDNDLSGSLPSQLGNLNPTQCATLAALTASIAHYRHWWANARQISSACPMAPITGAGSSSGSSRRRST